MAGNIEDTYLESFNRQNEEDPLGEALNELAQLIKPLVGDAKYHESIRYVLLLWASFRVYQLDPFPEKTNAEAKKEVQIVHLKNGMEILDYGFFLTTSPGENYGTYCTGKIIETSTAMIERLAKRGAVRVSIHGNDIAKRAAWIRCSELNIDITNFYPSEADYKVREIIYRVMQEQNKKRRLLTPEEELPKRPL